MKNHQIVLCSECASPDIQLSAWIEANTDKVMCLGYDGPVTLAYCPNCDQHVKWTEISIEANTNEEALEIYRRSMECK